MTLKAVCCPQVSLSLSFLLQCHEVKSFSVPHAYHYDYLPPHTPETTVPSDYIWSETVSQNKSFISKVFFLCCLVTVKENSLTQYLQQKMLIFLAPYSVIIFSSFQLFSNIIKDTSCCCLSMPALSVSRAQYIAFHTTASYHWSMDQNG